MEKVNLEEQTPVERQYPFQVRGKVTSIGWMAVLLVFSTTNSVLGDK